MSWLDGLFVFLIFALSFAGWRKGIVHIAVIISSYAAGITAAAVLAEPAGGLIAHYTGAPDVFSRVIAAVIIFILSALSIRGIGWLLKKSVSLALPGLDRACGLFFGLILSVMLIVLTSVFLHVSPVDSAAGRLYDESFTPAFLMSSVKRLWPEQDAGSRGSNALTAFGGPQDPDAGSSGTVKFHPRLQKSDPPWLFLPPGNRK